MTKRGKRANITPDGEATIIARALERPRLQRTALAEKLQVEFEGLGYDVPEIEVLERKISWYRNHATDDPQEKPWSTATLDNNYPIPPEALPLVLKVWKLCIEKGQGFTIREAKWAARLSGLLVDIETLSYKASQYARTELLYQLIDRPFDSNNLDRLLMGLPVALTGIESLLPLLAEQEDGIDQIRDIKQKKRKKLTIHPSGQNAISNESPHISLGLARELSEREVQIERTHNQEG